MNPRVVYSLDSRKLGFSVVIDGEVIHDFLLRIMIKGLAILNVRGGEEKGRGGEGRGREK